MRTFPAITVRLLVFAASPTITLAGIAFKGRPVTDDLRGTMARPILAALKDAYPDARFQGYDAAVTPENIRDLGLEPMDGLEAACDRADLIVIANNHPSFEAMPITRLAQHMAKPGLIYDFWNNFVAADLKLPNGIQYVALGSHSTANTS